MELLKASVAMSSIKEYPLAARHLLSSVLKNGRISVLKKVSRESQLVCGVVKGSKCK